MSTATATEREAITAEIQQSLDLLHEPGSVFEIRAVGVGRVKTVSGYFNNSAIAARCCWTLTEDREAAAVYVTLNAAEPSLLNRAVNRLKDNPPCTTTDKEIVRRIWLFIDLDPARATGISATEAERAEARRLASDIDDLLRQRGWPYPLLQDSGNGCYLLYRVDLENTDEVNSLVKAFYAGLNELIRDFAGGIKLDSSVCNAARIARVGGTMNRKGDSTPERPHRRSVLNPPDPDFPVTVVPIELIQEIAALAPAKPQTTARSASSFGKPPNVDEILTECGIPYRTKDVPDGMAYLIQCVFDENHGKNGETSIIQSHRGMTTYHCMHDTCRTRTWPQFLEKKGRQKPEWRGNGHSQRHDDPTPWEVITGESSRITANGANREFPPPPEPIQPISIGQLVVDYPKLSQVVIDQFLRMGEVGNFIAAPKVGKSWSVYGLSFCVATGRDWLDTFPCEQGKVLLFDNELQRPTIAYRLPKVAEAMGLEWSSVKDLIDVVPLRGTNMDIHGLRHVLNRIEADHYRLVIADAWYRFIPDGVSESDNNKITSLYNRLDEYSGKIGAAWLNIHHASKGEQGSKGVTDVGSGAGAQSRAPDAHIILRPHEDDDVFVLESAVRSFPPQEPICIKWEFPLWRPVEGPDPRKLKRPDSPKTLRQQADDDEGCRKIIAALFTNQRGTVTQLRKWTGMGPSRTPRLIGIMLADGRLGCSDAKHNGNSCTEYFVASGKDDQE